MTIKVQLIESEQNNDKFDILFAGLPPLGSEDYLTKLKVAPVNQLPAQVLVRAFRQLALSGNKESTEATLTRLLASPKHDYLKAVRRRAAEQVMHGQYVYDAEELVQETVKQIVITLPTDRGKTAETAWVLFTIHRLEDAWRVPNGRDGKKFPFERVEPKIDNDTKEITDPLDNLDGGSASWHVVLKESKLPWLEDFILRTIERIADPTIRLIAVDQFSDDPSPICAGISAKEKLPLTEQTGLSRFQIHRALRSAKSRLLAELLSQQECEINFDWLKKIQSGLGKPAQMSKESDDNRTSSEQADSNILPHRYAPIGKAFPDGNPSHKKKSVVIKDNSCAVRNPKQ